MAIDPPSGDAGSPTERELVKFLDRVDGEIRSYRQQTGFDKNCDTWMRWRSGDVSMQRGEEPVFQANVLGALIDKKIAQLTQSKPDIRVASRNAELVPAAHVLTDVCKAVLDQLQLSARVETAADLAATFGFVGFHTAWNPRANYGQGDIELEVLDPRRFSVDSRVKDPADIQQAQYIRIDTPMPLDAVRSTWPETGQRVRADSSLSGFQEQFNAGGGSWWGSALKRSLRPSNLSPGPYEWTMVRKYWLVSGQVDEDEMPMFPGGRVIHRAGDVVLDDMANPYWDSQWPVDIWDWRVNGDSYMGRSDVEEGRKLQETANRIGNAIAKAIILNAAITVIGDYNALAPEDWKRLDNRAARILRKMPGRELEFIPPPAIPDTYMNFVGILTNLMETVLAVPPSMQGKRQPGVVASSAVEGLMTQAEVGIRATARRLEYVIERIGQKLISRIIQFYTGDRVILRTGVDGDVEQYVFKRAQLLETYLNPQVPADEREAKLREMFSNFVFKVIPMSSMPSNKVQRGLMSLQLYQAGLIDEEEVLRMMELPDAKFLLSKIKQRQAAKEQQAEKNLPLAIMGVKPADLYPPGPGAGAKPTRSAGGGTKLKP